MASAESRLIRALEEMSREYGKNPSPALKHRIDVNRDRLNKMRGTPQAKKRIKKGSIKRRTA